MRAAATNPRAAGWRIVYWSGIKAGVRTVTQSYEPLSDANWSNLRPSAAALVSHSRPSVIKWNLSAVLYIVDTVDCCTYTVSQKGRRQTPSSIWQSCGHEFGVFQSSIKVLWRDVHVYRCTCVYLFHLPWLMTGLSNYTYNERFSFLNIPSLEQRRMRADLILCCLAILIFVQLIFSNSTSRHNSWTPIQAI